MGFTLKFQEYGKADVRLTHVVRDRDRHSVSELAAEILLQGDFDAAYNAADNRLVIPTDTMKNTFYVLAKQHGIGELEPFATIISRHFTTRFEHVTRATVRLAAELWQPLDAHGRPHPHAFVGTSRERATCTASASRGAVEVTSGLDGLRVLKTTDSAFSNFLRDEFTTLPDSDDRLFATTIAAEWSCFSEPADWSAVRTQVRQALLATFANHKSLSVQHTLYDMATAALDACVEVEWVTLTLPNQHRVFVDLSPFGLTNENEIFTPTDAPYGLIRATVSRNGGE